MIVEREYILRNGQQLKFMAAPVDPYDAFRGRYVSIGFKNSNVSTTTGEVYKSGQTVYVLLEQDDQGFSSFSCVTTKQPESGIYFKTKVRYTSSNNTVSVEIPFNRYYMEEKLAPLAETAYRKNSNAKDSKVYITVRILAGSTVLERLYIGDKTVEDFLKEAQHE